MSTKQQLRVSFDFDGDPAELADAITKIQEMRAGKVTKVAITRMDKSSDARTVGEYLADSDLSNMSPDHITLTLW